MVATSKSARKRRAVHRSIPTPPATATPKKQTTTQILPETEVSHRNERAENQEKCNPIRVGAIVEYQGQGYGQVVAIFGTGGTAVIVAKNFDGLPGPGGDYFYANPCDLITMSRAEESDCSPPLGKDEIAELARVIDAARRKEFPLDKNGKLIRVGAIVGDEGCIGRVLHVYGTDQIAFRILGAETEYPEVNGEFGTQSPERLTVLEDPIEAEASSATHK